MRGLAFTLPFSVSTLKTCPRSVSLGVLVRLLSADRCRFVELLAERGDKGSVMVRF